MNAKDTEVILKIMESVTPPAKEAGNGNFAKNTLQFLNFTGESVVATDTHILVILKKYPSTPHLGHADGSPADTLWSQDDYPKYSQLIPKKDQVDWRHTWLEDDGLEILYQLKAFLTGMDKAIKKDKVARKTGLIRLHHERDVLDLYTGCHGLVTKTRLLEGLKDKKKFDGYYAMRYVLAALEILNHTSAYPPLEMYVAKKPECIQREWSPVLVLENFDVLILLSPLMRIPDYDAVRRYSDQQIQKELDALR